MITFEPAAAVVFDGLTKAMKWLSDNADIVIPVLAVLAGAIAGVTLAVVALNIALYMNPIILIAMAIGAAIAGLVVLYAKVDWFRNAVDSVFGFIGDHWQVFVFGMLGPLGFVVGVILDNWKWIKNAGINAWNAIKRAWSAVKGFFSGIASSIGGAFSAAWSWVRNAAVNAWNFAKNAWNNAKGFFSGIGAAIRRVFGAAWDWVKNKIDGVIGTIKDAIGFVGNLISDIGDAASGGKNLPSGKTQAGAKGLLSARGGITLVGEKGPELVNLPSGSRVYSNTQSQKLLASAMPETGAAFAPEVRVFIGDQELTNIVRTELVERDRSGHIAYRAGAR